MINDNLMLVFKATDNNELQFDGSWWVHELSRAFYALPEFKEKFSIYHGFTLTQDEIDRLEKTFKYDDIDITRELVPEYPDQPRAFWMPSGKYTEARVSMSVFYNIVLSKQQQKLTKLTENKS
jgi:hypothetical protein